MKNRIQFDYDTSVLAPDGNFCRVLVIDYDFGEFEISDPSTGIPRNFAALPIIDQANILKMLREKTARRDDVEAVFAGPELSLELLNDRAWDVEEMNRQRGLR